jgi:hypothetical protein
VKESEKFIHFLKSYFKPLLICSVGGLIFGITIGLSKPSSYRLSALYELRYEVASIEQKIKQADEVVTQLRSAQLKKELNLDSENQFQIFKPGPASIQIVVNSSERDKNAQDLNKMEEYIFKNFDIQEIGEKVLEEKKANWMIYGLGGVIIGFLTGVFLSLLKEYKRVY